MVSSLNFKLGSLSGFFFVRVPYYIGDLKGDPNLENYPHRYEVCGVGGVDDIILILQHLRVPDCASKPSADWLNLLPAKELGY